MILADTHLLLWAAIDSPRLSRAASEAINGAVHARYFSAASVWEIAIKASQRQAGFTFDPEELRVDLLSNDWQELLVTGEHAVASGRLPLHHKDPFDRLLIAQAKVEGLTLLTSDKTVARYGSFVRKV